MIDICTILLNNSETERQTISYNTVSKKLFSSAIDIPLDTPPLNSIEDAEEYCHVSWNIDPSGVWDLQWIERKE
jgi:hypothetical protein